MIWDLSNPDHCRDFLKRIIPGPNGEPCTHLIQENGVEVPIDEASDEQLVQICSDLATIAAAQENEA